MGHVFRLEQVNGENMRLERWNNEELLAVSAGPVITGAEEFDGAEDPPDNLSDPKYEHAFGHVDLGEGVPHPWLAQGMSDTLVADPRWQLMDNADEPPSDPVVDSAEPKAHLTLLPILPLAIRRKHSGIDRLYRLVIRQVAVTQLLSDNRFLMAYEMLSLRRAIQKLFDNRVSAEPLADVEGKPLTSLADILDASLRTADFTSALMGAGFLVKDI